MLKILKASAGSGKTHNLAKEYIRLIIGSNKADAYRHVLAVTFTNKATDEMKRRILKELDILAKQPEKSPYFDEFSAQFPVARIQERAQQQLSSILHDYSAFSVSTIDRFFQQTLRAFSREIGQFSSYQVQLDRDALVTESVDRLLDNLTEEDRGVLDWLTQGVKAHLEQEGRFSLEDRLQKMAGSLQSLPEAPTWTREELKNLHQRCTDVVNGFHNQVKESAQEVLRLWQEAGVAPEDSYSKFMKALVKYAQPAASVKILTPPTDSFQNRAANPDVWFSKSNAHLLEKVAASETPLQAFLDLWDKPYQEYVTARMIREQIYSLGVAGELRDAFLQIQKEKNVICLDDSNTILKHIIDGTPTPFIYEKMGVRYEDFLLDEFQDTSEIQWENFRPLLHNADDAGFDSLVVGDVKQSIYRWRGSDWSLLGSRLEQDFRQTCTKSLDGNYRTCKKMVCFNNEFFDFAAKELDRITGAQGSLAKLYADVAQEPRFDDPAPGSVEVAFVDDQQAEILQTLQDLHGSGAHWSDIAILVRGNADGSAIAQMLVQEGIPVVSDDSLFVKSSVTVRRLVSQLSLVEAPPESDKPTVPGFLARSMDVQIPSSYHSLVDLAEALLREIREAYPQPFDAEIPYIQSFMDYLQDWVNTGGGNNLGAFLRAWEEANPKIASPSTGSSVRIMTVHKSKGLEFPFVILPFAEKIPLYKASAYWCRPQVEGTALGKEADGLYHIQLDSHAAHSLFAGRLQQEELMQAIDNLNILYVAMTRPHYGLKVIAATPPKEVQAAVKDHRPGDWKNLSHILYAFVKDFRYFTGTPYDLSSLDRTAKGPEMTEAEYPSYPAHSGERLRFSPEAADYFGPDGLIGPEASRRIRGNVLHNIMAQVKVAGDLPAAVQAAVASGELPRADAPRTLEWLQERVASVASRGWFSPSAQALCEAAILAPDGNEYRPDRVVVHPDGHVDIIDYKFGQPEERYRFQVLRYMNLWREMGYGPVSGFLWYLEDNSAVECK